MTKKGDDESVSKKLTPRLPVVYLDLDALAAIARKAVGPDVQVRDHGLLSSALARPEATVYGTEPYPDLYTKAAALMHSLIKNHAYVDGNKRVGLVAGLLFLALNQVAINASDDVLFDLTLAIASGDLDDIDEIAERLHKMSAPVTYLQFPHVAVDPGWEREP